MPITFVGMIAFLVFLRSFKATTQFVLFAFVLGALFQASAAFFAGTTGITPSHFLILTLLVLCVRKGNLAGKLAEVLRFPSAGLFLFMLVLYCLVAAYFLPRLFAGATDVNPVAGGGVELSGLPIFYALSPSAGNITQPIYVIGSISVFFFTMMSIESKQDYDYLLRALVTFAVANVFFGFLDVVTFYTHTDFIFSIIRNSGYVLRTDETGFLGLKRIAGSFSETSAYSAFSLVMFTFTTRLWLGAFNNKYLLLLSGMEFVFLLLSTSSTAIAGLLVMGTVLWVTSLARLVTGRVPSSVYGFVVFTPLVVCTVTLAILLNDTARVAVTAILNESLFNKAASASGIERLALNAQAFVNFSDSWGFGVGVGSARTSSMPLAVMSNVGIPGATLLAIFVVYIFMSKSSFAKESEEATFQQAARLACFSGLVTASISGTSMDLGLLFYMFAAASYLPRYAYWSKLAPAESKASLAQESAAL